MQAPGAKCVLPADAGVPKRILGVEPALFILPLEQLLSDSSQGSWPWSCIPLNTVLDLSGQSMAFVLASGSLSLSFTCHSYSNFISELARRGSQDSEKQAVEALGTLLLSLLQQGVSTPALDGQHPYPGRSGGGSCSGKIFSTSYSWILQD